MMMMMMMSGGDIICAGDSLSPWAGGDLFEFERYFDIYLFSLRRSLSLFVCFFVSLFAYSRVGRPVELLNSQEEEEEESQSESESKSSSSQGGHLFSYKYCKQSE